MKNLRLSKLCFNFSRLTQVVQQLVMRLERLPEIWLVVVRVTILFAGLSDRRLDVTVMHQTNTGEQMVHDLKVKTAAEPKVPE